MRRLRAAASVFALALAVAVACAGASPPPDPAPTPATPSAELGKPFTLAPGESASLESGKITVRFVSVSEDSRCPKNEQCVWAGNARIELEVRPGTGSPRAIALDTNPRGGLPQAELDGYFIVLEGVAPQPIAGRAMAAGDYRVTLSVTRGAVPRPGTDQPVL
jgi:hypothetical protein